MARGSRQYVNDLHRQAGGREPSKRLTALRALRPFLMPYRGTIAATAFALITSSAATWVLPAAVRGVIDHGFSDADAANIGRYFQALIVFAGVVEIASAVRISLVTWIGERDPADV